MEDSVSKHPVLYTSTYLIIKSSIIYFNQDSIHTQKETLQQEETGWHHSLQSKKRRMLHIYQTLVSVKLQQYIF